VKSVSRSFKIEAVSRMQRLVFDFLGFRFFWDSEDGGAMVFRNPWLLRFFIVVPYVLGSEVYYFRTRRFFVKLGVRVVALFALRVERNKVFVGSLAVSPECRRKGVGLFILSVVENLCRRMKMGWLELTVLKSNVPAQRLYRKFGFIVAVERRRGLVLRKKVP
jgi:ribosomal protein S18 acetylase RimI-like enzyme